MNGKRVMKTKQPVALLALLVLLCCTVAGTVAYLVTSTDPVTNTFTPAHVSTEVNESFTGGVKSNVTIKNTGDIPAYIRAAVIINWADANGNVYGGGTPAASTKEVTGDYTISYNTDGSWKQIGDYWYYTKPVAADSLTEKALIESCSPVAGKAPEGYNLQVTILADGIQADGVGSNGKTPMEDAWGVTPGQLN